MVGSKSLVSVTEVLLTFPQLQASHPHMTEFNDRKGSSLADIVLMAPSYWWGWVVVEGLSPEDPH